MRTALDRQAVNDIYLPLNVLRVRPHTEQFPNRQEDVEGKTSIITGERAGERQGSQWDRTSEVVQKRATPRTRPAVIKTQVVGDCG